MINSKGYEENLYYPNCIRTFSGIYVDVMNPTPEMFVIEDIAHALSQIPRFGGHLPIWYSVADHCLSCVASSIGSELELLMHDCTEAYLMDICTPVKKNLSNYYEIEDNLIKIISKKFGFQYPFSDYVKTVDKELLGLEWDSIMLGNMTSRFNIQQAKIEFLKAYHKYKTI